MESNRVGGLGTPKPSGNVDSRTQHIEPVLGNDAPYPYLGRANKAYRR